MSKHQELPPAYSPNAPNNAAPGIGFNMEAAPQAQWPQPPQGQWAPPPQTHQPQTTSSHTVVVTGMPGITPALGNCPSCRIGNVQAEFSCCGICLAIFFFPIGILCCLCMMNRRCSHCGALFG